MGNTYGAALASVTRNRNLRIAQLSSVSEWTGEFLFITAMTVYAYEQNGPGGVGVIGFLRVLPTTFALPLLGALADRMSRHRLLVVMCVLRAATAAGAAAAAAGGIPLAAYALVTVSTICHSAYRPVLAALLPTLCTTPTELASANAVRSILDGVASLIGPLAAAGILAASSPANAFVAVAALSAVAAVLVATLRYESVPPEATSGEPQPRARITDHLVDGLRELRGGSRASTVIVLGAFQCLVRGALLVLAVVIAVRLTGMGQSGVGVLWAAFGVGGLVAATATVGAAGSTRLGTLFGVGVAAWGLPIVVAGLWLHSWVAVAAFVVMGAANALVDVTGFTLLQRLVPDHLLARVLTVTEAVFALAVSVGSLVTAPLLSGLSSSRTIVATGCVLPVAVAAYLLRLRAMDADIRVRSDRIALLRRVSTLRLLPIAAIEGLALNLRQVRVAAGSDVFRAGDRGDGFYVIESGEVVVVEQGRDVSRLGPGDSFGEIALLRSVPRTATVQAVEDAEFAIVSGPRFVAAVTGFSATSTAMEQQMRTYLPKELQGTRS